MLVVRVARYPEWGQVRRSNWRERRARWVSPPISHDLTSANSGTVQPVISALGDLQTVAPEEIKSDLALMKGYLQVVVDSKLANSQVAEEDLVAADLGFGEVSSRVVQAVDETCGVVLQ